MQCVCVHTNSTVMNSVLEWTQQVSSMKVLSINNLLAASMFTFTSSSCSLPPFSSLSVIVSVTPVKCVILSIRSHTTLSSEYQHLTTAQYSLLC